MYIYTHWQVSIMNNLNHLSGKKNLIWCHGNQSPPDAQKILHDTGCMLKTFMSYTEVKQKASDHNVKMQFINALMLTSYVNFCTNLMFYLLLLYYLIHNQSTVSLYLQDYISITVPVY